MLRNRTPLHDLRSVPAAHFGPTSRLVGVPPHVLMASSVDSPHNGAVIGNNEDEPHLVMDGHDGLTAGGSCEPHDRTQKENGKSQQYVARDEKESAEHISSGSEREEESMSDPGDDGDDESDDEEEEEPVLKYERIGGPLNDLLKKDSASALAISNKLLVNTLQVVDCQFVVTVLRDRH
jgi:hypothetical protein